MKQIRVQKEEKAAKITLPYKAEVQVEKTIISYRNDHCKRKS